MHVSVFTNKKLPITKNLIHDKLQRELILVICNLVPNKSQSCANLQRIYLQTTCIRAN